MSTCLRVDLTISGVNANHFLRNLKERYIFSPTPFNYVNIALLWIELMGYQGSLNKGEPNSK